MKPRSTAVILSVLFSALTSLAVLAVAVVLRLGVEAGFQTYLDTAQAAVHGQVMGALEALPAPSGILNVEQVRSLGLQALRQGLVLGVADADGRTVWSAREQAADEVEGVFQTLEQRLRSRLPWERGWWSSSEHPVGSPEGFHGTMTLEVFQPRRLAASDVQFLETLDLWLVWAAGFGIALGILVGILTARALVKPIHTLRQTTRRLGEGDHAPPAPSPTVFREVKDLEADLSRLAARLAHLQELREQSGANTAHELRTPLANLEAQLEALEDGVLQPTPERFAKLRAETRRLLLLVQAWEDLERARDAEPSTEGCDPAEVVQAAAEAFRPRLQSRQQSLEIELALPPMTTRLRSDDWGRLVVNLVENAHRYTPKGGRIRVGLHAVESGVELVVDDDGPGIPAEHREAVFDRFYRVDRSRSRASGGLGLGLSLVRALVQTVGGTAAIETSPWGGCRVRVWMPVSRN